MSSKRVLFDEKLNACISSKAKNNVYISKRKYNLIIEQLKKIDADGPKTDQDYRLKNRYDVLCIGDVSKLVKKGTALYFIYVEEMYDVIYSAHHATGHGCRNILWAHFSKTHANVTVEAIRCYLATCDECQLKQKKVRKSLVVKPIVSNEMNSRCQVDLIDMQSESDRDFRFIMVYQDRLTKFVRLRALRTKTAEEVAYNLVDIFCDMGAPHILQSDNGREFANKIVQEVLALWSDCRMVHGKPRHSQSQGSVERANRDIHDKLVCWMRDNSTSKWADGLRFVQFQKNRAFHSGIERSPYEDMFGVSAKIGLASSKLPLEVTDAIETEEGLNNIFAQNDDRDVENVNYNAELCVACQRRTSGSHSCGDCGQFCHAIAPCSVQKNDQCEEREGFGSSVICSLCHSKNRVNFARTGAKLKQQQQAEKMKLQSAKQFKPAAVGDCVLVPVPDVDKGRADHRNIMAVVLEVENGFYRLGTKHGMLKNLYARNQFTISTANFITEPDVPKDVEVSVCHVATKESTGSGQGFLKCNCMESVNLNVVVV